MSLRVPLAESRMVGTPPSLFTSLLVNNYAIGVGALAIGSS